MRRFSVSGCSVAFLSLWSAIAHAQATPATAPTPRPAAPTRPAATAAPENTGPLLSITFPGELQVRYTAFTTIPLATTPGVSASEQAPSLNQNQYFEHWTRLSPRLSIGERFRVVTQFDIARAVIADAPTQGVELAREPRNDTFPYGGFDVRQGYIEWDSPIGLIRAGQQAFNLGLGILANDGDQTPVFNDYRYGDLVERLLLATRPAGRSSNLVVALAGDIVYRDRIAQLVNGDIAIQGVLSVFWQDHACRERCERKRVGATVTYRDLSFGNGTQLNAFVADLHARWEWPTPDHQGRVFGGAELAVIYGSTDAARTVNVAEHTIVQFGGAGEFGIERDDRYRIGVEVGYASGDRNPVDDVQRRFTFNPSHRVGLLMFPEVIAWQSARSASIATDPRLAGRPANGAFLLPTQGGVSGAAYVYPTARVSLGRYVQLLTGAVIGVATTDWVDPTSVQIYGTARNYRGGDATRRDLGLELDLGLNARFPLANNMAITGGLQGAVMFPGRAFDGPMGERMSTLALGQARLGLSF